MSDKAYFRINLPLTAVKTGIARVLAPITGDLARIFIRSEAALDGGDAIFDVNLNGASIFGDPLDRPTIADGDQTADVPGLAIAVMQYTDIITVDFDGFTDDAVTVGGDLAIILEFAEASGGGGSDSGALVVNASPQAVANDTIFSFPTLAFPTVTRDDGGYFDSGNNTLAIPTGQAGWYSGCAEVRWGGSSTGYRKIQVTYYNGVTHTTIAQATVQTLSDGVVQAHQCHFEYWLDEGWRIDVQVYQNSGGSLNADACILGLTPAGKR